MAFIFFIIVLSIPFHLIWNALAPTYFYWLPAVYQNIPFLDCLGLFTLAAILRSVILPSRPIVKKITWGARSGYQHAEKYVNR
jgi:hypothetical protein